MSYDYPPLSAHILALMLQRMGQTVFTAHSGQEAIEWLASNLRPDAVFLDIAMPNMSGYEVAQHLRMNPDLDETILIALTGYGQDEDRKRAFDAGFNYHMVKPTSLDALEQLLRSIPLKQAHVAMDSTSEQA